MAITVELPDDIEQMLESEWSSLERHALEGLITEAFRQGMLSSSEVARALGLAGRWDAVEFLSLRGAYPGYELEDLQEDRTTITRAGRPKAE